jgi:hypothetical protein
MMIMPRSAGIPRPSERPRIRPKLFSSENKKKDFIN